MDFLEFIARSEWPLVVGGTAWLLRQPLKDMIARINITKIDAWGLKAEFEKGLAKVELLTKPTSETALPPEKPTLSIAVDEAIESRLNKNSKRQWAGPTTDLPSPEMTVLNSWRLLEGTMRKFWDDKHPRHGPTWVPPAQIEQAARELGFSDDEVDSLLVLRRLRNAVAHSVDVQLSWDDATRFKQSVDRLLTRLFEKSKPKDEHGGKAANNKNKS